MTEPEPTGRSTRLTVGGLGLAARIGTQVFTRVRVEGDLDAIPAEGPVILAANHVSNLDGVLLGGWVIARVPRRIHWLGKREMFELPIVRGVLHNYGVHPVDRSGADIEAFRTAQGILEAGQALLIFPEGTRSRDGSLQKARDGLAMLALRTGAPIVPIGVADTDKVWPKDRKPRPWPGGHVTVRIGTPFRVADEIPADLDRKTAKSRATDVIMRRIAALLPERQRGPYA